MEQMGGVCTVVLKFFRLELAKKYFGIKNSKKVFLLARDVGERGGVGENY